MLPAPGWQCVPPASGAKSRCEYPLENEETRHTTLHRALAQLGALPRTYFFTLHDLLCSTKVCGAVIPGTNILAFRDVMHLTPAGSHYLAPFLCSFLTQHSLMP